MKLKNNKQEQEQILKVMDKLGFDYYNWNDLENMEHLLIGGRMEISGDWGTLFLEIDNEEITGVNYLPFPETETHWVRKVIYD